jgi:hypothetical protein
MRRLFLYLWVAPTSAPGLVMVVLARATGGGVAIVDGVIEAHGGAATFFLRRIVGIWLRGGASAMTLGHVVIGQTPDDLERTRSHERIHVEQCERWGPLFFPAYLTASIIALARGKSGYRDNAFEREAFDGSKIRPRS